MYKVIVRFTDLQDGGHVYNVGDVFPRSGVSVSAERLEELSTDRNRRHVAVIASDVPEKALPEVTEGLSDNSTGVDGAAVTEPKKRPRKRKEK